MPDVIAHAFIVLLSSFLTVTAGYFGVVAARMAAPREHRMKMDLLDRDIRLRELEIREKRNALDPNDEETR